MKCFNCGSELSDDAKFCSICGTNVSNVTIEETSSASVETTSQEKLAQKNKMTSKFHELWNRLSLFGKIATISIVVSVLLGLVAFLAHRTFAVIISIIWFIVTIVALLMKKSVIKVSKSWIPLLAVILSFVLIVPYFSLFRVNTDEREKYDWNVIILADMLPVPESPYGETISNSDSYLMLHVEKATQEQFLKYIEDCKEKGFTIDAETNSDFFFAYNEQGYELSLSLYDYNAEMHINLSAGMELGTLSWSDSELAQLLPMPKSTVGNVQQDDEKEYSAYVGKTTIEDFNSYVKSCEDKGFTVDLDKSDKRYSAKNADGYKLSVEYQGNNIIYISLEMTEQTPETTTDDTQHDTHEWTVDYGDATSFEKALNDGVKVNGKVVQFEVNDYKPDSVLGINCWAGEHLNFISESEIDVVAGDIITAHITEEPSKVLGSWKIPYELLDINNVKTDTTVPTTSEESTEPEKTEPEAITISMISDSSSYEGRDCSDVKSELEDIGFKNITIDEEITTDTSFTDGCVVSVTANGAAFNSGDSFEQDVVIVITYWKVEKPVSEYELAFVRKLSNYSLYYMFDTDTKTVVQFGTDDTYLYKGTYSGSFSSGVTMTWDHGEWTDKFIYSEGSSNATYCDGYGTEWEYTTCDLKSAQALLDTRER